MAITTPPQSEPATIGWEGQTLHAMLTESEQRFEKTGRYHGVERLTMQGDVETWETLEPLLYLSRRIRPSTAGMGRQRGGSGWEALRMVWKTDDLVLYNLGEGHVFHGNGLFGGYPGCTDIASTSSATTSRS